MLLEWRNEMDVNLGFRGDAPEHLFEQSYQLGRGVGQAFFEQHEFTKRNTEWPVRIARAYD